MITTIQYARIIAYMFLHTHPHLFELFLSPHLATSHTIVTMNTGWVQNQQAWVATHAQEPESSPRKHLKTTMLWEMTDEISARAYHQFTILHEDLAPSPLHSSAVESPGDTIIVVNAFMDSVPVCRIPLGDSGIWWGCCNTPSKIRDDVVIMLNIHSLGLDSHAIVAWWPHLETAQWLHELWPSVFFSFSVPLSCRAGKLLLWTIRIPIWDNLTEKL